MASTAWCRYVFVCVCEREREREYVGAVSSQWMVNGEYDMVQVCARVCERERVRGCIIASVDGMSMASTAWCRCVCVCVRVFVFVCVRAG